MLTQRFKKPIAFLLILATLAGLSGLLSPLTAWAAGTVTITANFGTEEYFEYQNSGGSWNNLKTAFYEVTGAQLVTFCLRHDLPDPTGHTYREWDINEMYSEEVQIAIRTLLANAS